MTVHPKALYLECTRTQALTAWLGVGSNVLLALWLGYWLIQHHGAISPSLLFLFSAFAIALFIADFFSGVVHWATDTWFDEVSWERVISIAREHHLFPHHIVAYPFRDYVAFSSWPAVALVGPIALYLTVLADPTRGGFFLSIVCFIISAIMVFGTHAHRLGHRTSNWRITRLLQHSGLLITTSHHGVHHRGNHDVRYCVINGWANYVCDKIRFWRCVEWLIQRITGAVPRRNDHEWQRRFDRK